MPIVFIVISYNNFSLSHDLVQNLGVCSCKNEILPLLCSHAAKCIDYYTSLRVKKYEGRQDEPIDPKLEAIVNRMFQRCFDDQEYKQAIGIALETRRNDILQKAILESVRKNIFINCISNFYNCILFL